MSDRARKWNKWVAKKNTQGRNGLIGKIHVARAQLAMEEDSYRALLRRVTKRESCKDMTMDELESVLREFTRIGFKPVNSKRIGQRKQATHPQATKIRKLWLILRDIGELNDPSEDALAAFVENVSGARALQWLTPHDADAVIKALRGWIKRVEKRDGIDAGVEA